MLKTLRIREEYYCFEFTTKEDGRPVTVCGGEVSQVVKLADRNAGILMYGRNGIMALMEPYEAVRDALFPVIEEILRRKTVLELAEDARFKARLKAQKEESERKE